LLIHCPPHHRNFLETNMTMIDSKPSRTRMAASLLGIAAVFVSSAAAAGSPWKKLPGCAKSLAGNWVVGCTTTARGGNAAYYWKDDRWNAATHTTVSAGPSGTVVNTYQDGGINITTDASGVAWVVDSAGRVKRWKGGYYGFETVPGRNCENTANVCARHEFGPATLAVGKNANAWILDCASAGSAGYKIRRYTGSCWQLMPGAGMEIAVDYNDEPWVINAVGDRFNWRNGRWNADPSNTLTTFRSITRGAALHGADITTWRNYGEWRIWAAAAGMNAFRSIYATQSAPVFTHVGVSQTEQDTEGANVSGAKLYAVDYLGGIYEYIAPKGIVFQNITQSTDPSRSWDWDPGRGKLTCPNGEGLMAVSELYYGGPVLGYNGPVHAGLCLPRPGFGGVVAATLVNDVAGGRWRYRHYRPGGVVQDWAPGLNKLECGKSEYVSAISANTVGAHGNNRLHAIQCTYADGPTYFRDVCEPRALGWDYLMTNAGTPNIPAVTSVHDWDPGYRKGACESSEYMAGISADSNGYPSHLLCCRRVAPTVYKPVVTSPP
jgi:hypothetical protein